MRAALVLACLTLAACQTPCPPPAADAPTLSRFQCEDGSELQVTFTRDQAVVVQEGYATLTLPSRISGSGYRYADNGADLRGRMSEARWTRPGAAETICQQRQ
jgi:membrane-bound inhibitor of C-type lysozyme